MPATRQQKHGPEDTSLSLRRSFVGTTLKRLGPPASSRSTDTGRGLCEDDGLVADQQPRRRMRRGTARQVRDVSGQPGLLHVTADPRGFIRDVGPVDLARYIERPRGGLRLVRLAPAPSRRGDGRVDARRCRAICDRRLRLLTFTRRCACPTEPGARAARRAACVTVPDGGTFPRSRRSRQ